MAKIYGFSGKVTGKKGDAVFAVRNGDNVVRQYNPIVANPNTVSQQNARAKMKLMSQLGAIFATIIAIARDGSKSPRNQFSSVNYPILSVVAGKPQADLPSLQLTKSSRDMEVFSVSRSNGTEIQCALTVAALHSRVVYAIVAKDANEKLRVFDSTVVENTTPGEANTFAAKMRYTSEAIVVYAYAIDDINSEATTRFGNIFAPTAQEVATLITTRSVNTGSFYPTATKGAYLEVGTDDAVAGAGSSNPNSAPTVPTIGGYSPFAEFTEVTMNAEAGASIYYTTDGSNPTSASTLYDVPIRIENTTTFKAIAVKNGRSSNVTTRTFTKSGGAVTVQAPVITGTNPFATNTNVTITAEAGATIYYTLDGSVPTESSTQYANAFQLNATTTVKAIARLQNTNSAVTTVVFTKQSDDGQD